MKCKKHLARRIKPLKDTPKNRSKGCVNCGELLLRLPMTYNLELTDYLLRDDNVIFFKDYESGKRIRIIMRKIEALARRHPYCNWKLFFLRPLYSVTYQR